MKNNELLEGLKVTFNTLTVEEIGQILITLGEILAEKTTQELDFNPSEETRAIANSAYETMILPPQQESVKSKPESVELTPENVRKMPNILHPLIMELWEITEEQPSKEPRDFSLHMEKIKQAANNLYYGISDGELSNNPEQQEFMLDLLNSCRILGERLYKVANDWALINAVDNCINISEDARKEEPEPPLDQKRFVLERER